MRTGLVAADRPFYYGKRGRHGRCCPWKSGQLVKAIHVLQTREIGG